MPVFDFTLPIRALRVAGTFSANQFGLRALVVGSVCLALGAPTQAQQPHVATRVDSLRAARVGTPVYFPARFTFTNGKQVDGFLPGYTTCFLERVDG